MAKKRPIKQKLMYVIMGSVGGAALISLMQLWFSAFSESVFFKLLITFAIAVVVAGVLLAVLSDLQDDEAHKKDNLLN
jgi:hypothetical protein